MLLCLGSALARVRAIDAAGSRWRKCLAALWANADGCHSGRIAAGAFRFRAELKRLASARRAQSETAARELVQMRWPEAKSILPAQPHALAQIAM